MGRPEKMKTAGVFSLGMRFKPFLGELLGIESLIYLPIMEAGRKADVILGWGNKSSFIDARQYARRKNIRHLSIEDGWIKSLGSGKRYSGPYSIVVDDLGIYYDATRESRLERLISDAEFNADEIQHAETLLEKVVELGVSKFNLPLPSPELVTGSKVLVVDQTCGDLSISYGLANRDSFGEMLNEALAKNPDSTVYLKVHPDVVSGRKTGHYDLKNLPDRVRLIADAVDPIALIDQVDKVYVVTSQLGFEALIRGKAVICFGMPYYAGWGLTEDRVSCSRRKVSRTLVQVFAAAYFKYSKYINPVSGKSCELDELLDVLSVILPLHRKNAGRFICIGFRKWKHYLVRAFLQSPGNEIVFFKDLSSALSIGLKPSDKLVVWARDASDEIQQYCSDNNLPLHRIEDGFIRSVGLGSDFVKPVSLVVDNAGIYYDPADKSELELILESTVFTENDGVVARKLQQKIIELNVTKYNLDSSDVNLPVVEPGRRKILVPGQVEDDASVQRGGGAIQNNLQLLQTVRAKNPDAFIVFKSHPDVESGNRKSATKIEDLKLFCDSYITDVGITHCLEWADEVHTLTSLTGFEALIRNIPVFTYGAPFYAGWGLTRDHVKLANRSRKLSITELIAGVLLYYPRYYHWPSQNFVSAENAIDVLADDKLASSHLAATGGRQRRMLLKIRQLSNVIKYSGWKNA